MAAKLVCPKCNKAIEVTAFRSQTPIECACGAYVAVDSWITQARAPLGDSMVAASEFSANADDQGGERESWLETRWLLHGRDIDSGLMLRMGLYSIFMAVLFPIGMALSVVTLVKTRRYLRAENAVWITGAVQDRLRAAHCLAWIALVANSAVMVAMVAWWVWR